MHNRHFCTLVAAVALLSGCGGGGSTHAPPSGDSALPSPSDTTSFAASDSLATDDTSSPRPGDSESATADNPLVDPGETPIAVPTNADFRYEMATGSVPLGAVTYAAVDPPRGLRIQPATGIVTWHPTEDQQGEISVTIEARRPSGETYAKILHLSVVPGESDAPGIYVAPDGDDATGDGSPAHPYATITHGIEEATPGDTVYVRGGVYHNATYGDGRIDKWDPAVRVTTDGAPDAWITVRPLGNEWVKIKFDAGNGILVSASYIVVDGFEVEGNAAEISYEEAIALWWSEGSPSITDGKGINVRAEHVVVRNTVVHHTPSRGLGGYNTDHVIVENNIVYDTNWWTLLGTHGITFPTMASTDGDADALKYVIRNNLVFGNEQRIMSRGWNGGSAHLTVDEGYGIHLQDTNHTHVGKVRIENNLCVFNGKAGIGLFDVENATISHNSTYKNGLTTGPGTGSGLNLQAAQDAYVEGNLFHAQPTHKAIFTLQGATYTAAGNWVVPGTDDPDAYPPGVTAVFAVFADPEHGDFSPSDQVDPTAGIDGGILQDLLAKAADYGIVIAPTGYTVDYAAMTRDIVEGAPAGTTLDMTNWPDAVFVDFPAGSTHPAAPRFELIIDYPY